MHARITMTTLLLLAVATFASGIPDVYAGVTWTYSGQKYSSGTAALVKYTDPKDALTAMQRDLGGHQANDHDIVTFFRGRLPGFYWAV